MDTISPYNFPLPYFLSENKSRQIYKLKAKGGYCRNKTFGTKLPTIKSFHWFGVRFSFPLSVLRRIHVTVYTKMPLTKVIPDLERKMKNETWKELKLIIGLPVCYSVKIKIAPKEKELVLQKFRLELRKSRYFGTFPVKAHVWDPSICIPNNFFLAFYSSKYSKI